ncbi:frataxin homolog, mitochondrial [Anastrepha obliqua]|uniref:frataxin homolog, mitochondrial n=1 Tax=Anastrepha obliqua TaxID=95512 RepID=UPI00240A49BD|nr:frataxin homolog, mitochondrial [Anastrepha obliqua]
MSGLATFRALRRIRINRSTRDFLKSAREERVILTNAASNSLLLHCQKPPSFRNFATTNNNKDGIDESNVDSNTYERVCSETLDALCDYFEELIENSKTLSSSDVTYGDGVLTVNLGNENGTYVINRQTPNKQIWLSSPTSGPKRYDFVTTNTKFGRWVYKHNGETLHELLQKELPEIFRGQQIDFSQLPYGS